MSDSHGVREFGRLYGSCKASIFSTPQCCAWVLSCSAGTGLFGCLGPGACFGAVFFKESVENML